MMAFAPDIDQPFPLPEDNGNNASPGGSRGRRLPAFQPGQLNALASQLNEGFGGGLGNWKADLRNTFGATKIKPFNYGGGGHGNGGGKKDGGGNTPGTGPNRPTDGGFDTFSPRNRMMPMNAQQPATMPQMGLLSTGPVNVQQPRQQQQGLLGDMPSYVLEFIRSRGV